MGKLESQHGLTLQVSLRNIIYLNCGERYEDTIGYHSYTHNLSTCVSATFI